MMKAMKIKKRIRRLYRRMRFQFWMAGQDYIHNNIGIHEGPPQSYYWRHSAEELEQERRAVLEAIDRLIKENGERYETKNFKSGGKSGYEGEANGKFFGKRYFTLDGKHDR